MAAMCRVVSFPLFFLLLCLPTKQGNLPDWSPAPAPSRLREPAIPFAPTASLPPPCVIPARTGRAERDPTLTWPSPPPQQRFNNTNAMGAVSCLFPRGKGPGDRDSFPLRRGHRPRPPLPPRRHSHRPLRRRETPFPSEPREANGARASSPSSGRDGACVRWRRSGRGVPQWRPRGCCAWRERCGPGVRGGASGRTRGPRTVGERGRGGDPPARPCLVGCKRPVSRPRPSWWAPAAPRGAAGEGRAALWGSARAGGGLGGGLGGCRGAVP